MIETTETIVPGQEAFDDIMSGIEHMEQRKKRKEELFAKVEIRIQFHMDHLEKLFKARTLLANSP